MRNGPDSARLPKLWTQIAAPTSMCTPDFLPPAAFSGALETASWPLAAPFPSLLLTGTARLPFPSFPPFRLPPRLLGFWNASVTRRSHARKMAVNLNKNTTFGAAFAGFAASCLCLGIQSMQTYTYFKRYPLDKWPYKALVAGLLIVEVADQALIAHAVYSYVVSNWGEPSILLKPPLWSLILQITFGVATGTIVKLSFATRVWRFSKQNVFVTGFIVLLTLGEVGVASLYTVQGFRLKSLKDLGTMKTVGMLSLGIGVGTDAVIAFALCFFLRNLRTGHRQDDSMVNSLILYALSTGAITAAISLTTLILYNFMPDNFIFMAFYFVLSKMYAISFLAALNTRRVSRGRGTDAEETATVPTFLMVGKLTQRTVQIDPEYAEESPISPSSKTMMVDGKGTLSPATSEYSKPEYVHYAEAW